MKTYIVYYTCPHCPSPDCGGDPTVEANEGVYADSKTEARKTFQRLKMCRYMKITRIEEESES